MKAIHFVFCLFAVLMLTTTNGHAAAANEDFQAFLKKFTSSASFQYSRIKFPLKTPIALLEEDGETEKVFPFTREKWALLGEDAFKEERITDEEGGVYVSRFTVNNPKHKEFNSDFAILYIVFIHYNIKIFQPLAFPIAGQKSHPSTLFPFEFRSTAIPGSHKFLPHVSPLPLLPVQIVYGKYVHPISLLW